MRSRTLSLVAHFLRKMNNAYIFVVVCRLVLDMDARSNRIFYLFDWCFH